MAGCRDCTRCTEISINKMILFFPRLCLTLLFAWNIGLFIKKCPQCKHPLRGHKVIDGRFAD